MIDDSTSLDAMLAEGYGVDDATVQRLMAASPLRAPAARRSNRETATERMVENAAASVGREVGRSLIRGILGNLGR